MAENTTTEPGRVAAELRAAAIACKKEMSQRFALVDPATARQSIRGKDEFLVTRKIDGVMACAFFRDGAATLVGSGGKALEAPCAEALAASLRAADVQSATVVCELYLPVASGRPRVGDALAALADPKRVGELRLAPFDIVEIDGAPFAEKGYAAVHAKLSEWFGDEAVRPVEMRTAQGLEGIEEIYGEWVEGEGAEGLVIHAPTGFVWKMKPRHSVDAVLVGYTVGDLGLRNALFAVRDEAGDYRIAGIVGGGFSEEARRSLLGRLRALDCPSKYAQADRDGVAFRMVRPEIVAELSVGEFVAEESDGRPKFNPIVSWDPQTGWTPRGRSAGVSALRIVFERLREDKTPDPALVAERQITDLCPFAAPKAAAAADLPKSEILARRVFVNETTVKGVPKLMVQKFLVWKTNKEKADPRYPAYVYHYTDYSSARGGKDGPLKRQVCISSDRDQILALLEADIAKNMLAAPKDGGEPKTTDGGEPQLKRGWKEAK